MKCNYLLKNKKCSLVGHRKSKEGLALIENNICNLEIAESKCRYYENENNFDEGDFFPDYGEDEYQNEFRLEKLNKKKHFEN